MARAVVDGPTSPSSVPNDALTPVITGRVLVVTAGVVATEVTGPAPNGADPPVVGSRAEGGVADEEPLSAHAAVATVASAISASVTLGNTV